MYSYDRRKTAAKLDVFHVWHAIVEKHEAAERKEFAALLHELVNYFHSVGYDLDVGKSYIAKNWHGSDGWRMEGMFTIVEREENTVKATKPQQVEMWVEEATGLHGSAKKIAEKDTPRGSIGTWQVDITQD
jgi:hypothetical protein